MGHRGQSEFRGRAYGPDPVGKEAQDRIRIAQVAAKLAAWVNYICPVKGAREEMEKIDPSLVDNQLIFPDEDMLSQTWDFMALDDRQQIQYEGEWSDVSGG